MRVFPVIFQALALDGEDRRAASGDRGGGVVLRRIDVARGPAEVGAQCRQRLDEHRGLNGHVQRTGDARALERLLGAVFFARRHQARHFGLGEIDLLAAPIGEVDVFDGVIVGHGNSFVAPRARFGREWFTGRPLGRVKAGYVAEAGYSSAVRNRQEGYKEICISLFYGAAPAGSEVPARQPCHTFRKILSVRPMRLTVCCRPAAAWKRHRGVQLRCLTVTSRDVRRLIRRRCRPAGSASPYRAPSPGRCRA